VLRTPLSQGDRIELKFDLLQYAAEPPGVNNLEDRHTFRHGPLVLGCAAEQEVSLGRDADLVRLHKARYETRDGEVHLAPVNDVVHMSEQAARSYRRQILFR
jgi:hypothetical protein